MVMKKLKGELSWVSVINPEILTLPSCETRVGFIK